jgi:hypothetical protein
MGCWNFKSAALEHDSEKWAPVFGKDHAPAIGYSAMTIRRKSHRAGGISRRFCGEPAVTTSLESLEQALFF